MATKKQEAQLNKLYAIVKSLDLQKDDINFINIRGFLYSVGRINVLQCVASLTKLCLENGITLDEINESLKD